MDTESRGGLVQTVPAQATVMMLGLCVLSAQLTITTGVGDSSAPGPMPSFLAVDSDSTTAAVNAAGVIVPLPEGAASARSQPVSGCFQKKKLQRALSIGDYDQVLDLVGKLGFEKVYTQEIKAALDFLPDFKNPEDPFPGNRKI